MIMTILHSFFFGITRYIGKKRPLLKRISPRIRARLRRYKANQKLKKSGYKTWAQYRHYRDNDVCSYMTSVVEYYRGYNHIHRFSVPHYAYTCLYDYGAGGIKFGYDAIYEWCDKHMKHKWRMDYLRSFCRGTNDDGPIEFWEINEMGGGDYVYAAFKDEKDYVHFLLRWG